MCFSMIVVNLMRGRLLINFLLLEKEDEKFLNILSSFLKGFVAMHTFQKTKQIPKLKLSLKERETN